MAFPTRWAQAWIHYTYADRSTWSGTLWWFTFEGSLIPAFSADQLAVDACDWWTGSFGHLTRNHAPYYNNSPFATAAFNDGGGVQHNYVAFGTLPWLRGDFLPLGLSIVIRKRTGTTSRRGMGRCYINQIAPEFIEGNRLTPLGHLTATAACNAASFGFYSQGTLFLPALVSWVDGTLTTLTGMEPNWQVGYRIKRAQPQGRVRAAGYTPPPP